MVREIKHYPKKRRRTFTFLLSGIVIFAILFLSAVTYSLLQYESGKKDAENKIVSNEMDESAKKDTNSTDDEKVEVKKPENDEPIHVLLIGVDSEKNEPARTDTIMIAQYDPKAGKAKLASIMRDTYVEIPGYANNKINAAFAFGGAELLRQTIEQNFNLNIHYYALVNFDGFVNIVDTIAPDGLEVDIDHRMYYQDPTSSLTIDFQPGRQKLNGEKTLHFVRYRSDNENDFGRVKRQQEVVTLLKDELLTLSGLTRVPRLIGAVEPHLETNIRLPQLFSLGRDFVLNPVNQLQTLRIPIDDGYVNEYYSHAGAVLEIDLEKNVEALNSFFFEQTTVVTESKTSENES